ncbi:hypothetical protein ACGFNU_05765 [Spirillospora sp. NPDC048911]|uniref:hypothetical protein n=1 Tax=Spirillospora sp. NPDC048911 TaxID=3364527 RepID=UPI0037215EE8
MPVYEEYVRASADEASDVHGDAESRVYSAMNNGDPMEASAVVAVVAARAVAEWWRVAVDAIDNQGLDAADALALTRQAARRCLIEHTVPRHACPVEQEFARTRIEAARTFYRTTAHLEEITTTAATRTPGAADSTNMAEAAADGSALGEPGNAAASGQAS